MNYYKQKTLMLPLAFDGKQLQTLAAKEATTKEEIEQSLQAFLSKTDAPEEQKAKCHTDFWNILNEGHDISFDNVNYSINP